MARLRDISPVLKHFGTWAFIRRVAQQVSEDNILVWASALAYSWLFAVFPFLIFLLTLAPYLPAQARNSAIRNVTYSVTTMLGKAASTVNDNLENVIQHRRRGLLGIGLGVSLWAASGGMAMTMAAFDQCYDIRRGRPYYRQRPLAMALTIIAAACMLSVMVLLPIGSAVQTWLWHRGLFTVPLAIGFNIARYLLAVVLLLFLLAVIYYFGPSIHQKFVFITPGAAFSIIVWLFLDYLFRFYVDRFARYDQTYGTVGGVALLLLFFYIDAVVLLIGAEINSEIDFQMFGEVTVKKGAIAAKPPAYDAPASGLTQEL
ncbi:MAG: YihY/virulence factor BrkB family protein [Planctomycetota bacterium]|nr:YihY/virulence factor BrkB family protein [Planctomycetota bacterium]